MDGSIFWTFEVRVYVHLSNHVFCIFSAWPCGVCKEAILGTEEFFMVANELGGVIIKFSVPSLVPI